MPTASYYFVKITRDLLTSPEVKGLRARPRGDTLLVILLELALLAQDRDGVLTYSGVEPTAAREWACQIGEAVEDVEATLLYSIKVGWAEPIAETPEEIRLAVWEALVGKETYGAIRQRRYRASLPTTEAPITEAAALPEAKADKAKRKREKPVYNHDATPYMAAHYFAQRCAKNALEDAVANGATGKVVEDYMASEERIQVWADDIRKLNEIDGRSWEEIENTILYVVEDPFERTVVLSARKLRARFPQLAAKAAAAARKGVV